MKILYVVIMWLFLISSLFCPEDQRHYALSTLVFFCGVCNIMTGDAKREY